MLIFCFSFRILRSPAKTEHNHEWWLFIPLSSHLPWRCPTLWRSGWAPPAGAGTGPDVVPENYVQPTFTSGPLASRDEWLISLWLSLPGKKKRKKIHSKYASSLWECRDDNQMWPNLYLAHFLICSSLPFGLCLFFSLSPISPNPCKNNK